MVVCRVVVFFLAVAATTAQQIPTPATGETSPFLTVPPAESDELRFAAQVPDFEAQDIHGRTWRTGDLAGKFTVLYLWSTFSARATDRQDPHGRRSIPRLVEIQQFYDKVKNGSKIQVLTFCQDYDYTHAPAYMKEKNYTFPVIADWTLIGKLFPKDTCLQGCSSWAPSPTGQGTPLASAQWVVNPEGRLSSPFHNWSLGHLLMEVEKLAAAK